MLKGFKLSQRYRLVLCCTAVASRQRSTGSAAV